MPHVTELPSPLRTVHVMGVGGTAMAALAGMLVDAGYAVSGSDAGRVYPPMSDYLARLGIVPLEGYRASNLDHRPDLVVVGNAIRAVYEEAQALLASDIPYMSFPEVLGARFMEGGSHNIVVAGTHGKTTTTSLLAWLLEAAGLDPGFLIGGIAANFDRTARPGAGRVFAIEGDEYDTAFFDKGPKFLHYRPTTAIVTSVEFDHADIYRDLAHVQESFRRLVHVVPRDGSGCIVARWDHDTVAEVIRDELGAIATANGAGDWTEAGVEVRRYGPGEDWDGRIEDVDTTAGTMRFSVLERGRRFGTFTSGLVGEHNLYNQVAAVAALTREGLTADALASGFTSFRGIKRRQEVVGEPGTVTVIDDFAHHPTAVRVTLDALRLKYGGRRLWAIFEPRSNTSRRAVFQDAYADAFGAADVVVIAPAFGTANLGEDERLDVGRLVDAIRGTHREAFAWGGGADVGEPTADLVARRIAASVVANALPEDVIAVLSNGGFGGLHGKLLTGLADRFSR